MSDIFNVTGIPRFPEVEQEMLNIREVGYFFGGKEAPLDPSTIYRWVATGKLAPGIQMGHRTTRWRRSDCQKTLDAMAAQAVRE